MIRSMILTFALVGCVDTSSAPDAISPDAAAYPTCASLGCPSVSQTDRVCATTGECYCDQDGRGPAPKVRCEP